LKISEVIAMESIDEWFSKNSIDLSDTAITLAPAAVLDHAWFNSETARLSISTEIQSKCETCEIQSECPHQRGKSIIALTGDGDGDYLVRALLSNTVPPNSAYSADGAIIVLDPAIESTVDSRYNKLRFQSPPLAPLLLGSLTVENHSSSHGQQPFGFLFISDAEATIDSSYFIVDLPLARGEYKVVAFMGAAMFQTLSPRIIGIFGEAFSGALDEAFEGLKIEPELKLEDLVKTNEQTTVLSRIQSNMDHLSSLNSELLYDRNALLSDSWAIQRYFEGSAYVQNRMDSYLPQSEYTPLQWIQTADALRIRGLKAHSDSVLTKLLGSGMTMTAEEDAYLLAVMRAKAGVWPA